MKPFHPPLLMAICLLATFRAGADVVAQWNGLMLDAIRNESTSPPLAARNLAILHAAIYDAVNGIERTHRPYFAASTGLPGASIEAAAVRAAYDCLGYLYPSQQAAFDTALNSYLSTTPESQSRSDGLSYGGYVALLILSWRNNDGSSTTVPYIPSTDPGQWRRTPPFFRPPELPQWPYVTPFTMTNGTQFRPPGPPALTSARYASDCNQVKTLGALNSTNRTADQTQIARFWSDFSFSVTPPGHWNAVAENIVTNSNLQLADSARLFALLNLAMGDAAIACWDAKYHYNFWRPVTAIQQADTDANPDTLSDTNWLPLLTTPSFPEYMSGHSTFSGAAATILASFAGSNNVPFSIGSDALPGVIRSYTNLWEAAEEVGMSRIYGGIHYLSSDLDGLATGRSIADYVSAHFLLPLSTQPRFTSIARLPNGQIRCELNGAANVTYIMQASADLQHWQSLTTNAAPGGILTFTDSNAPAFTQRSYRALINQ